ncbi:hypothetical protein [Kribbella sp. NBC_00359]|uniref:hypothetical protein n=1 Tax=Kribbella sp. NBC_00359 TaxID=2975966 RepID=UPI002E2037EF
MIAKLNIPRGGKTYKKRAAIIEPVRAQIKHDRKIRDLSRRSLAAVDSEWKRSATTCSMSTGLPDRRGRIPIQQLGSPQIERLRIRSVYRPWPR